MKNIPPSFDEKHIQMFFEYEKGQGGGPVKNVSYDQNKRLVVVEFERAASVDVVLKKRPVK